ncbi:MAG: HAD-IC family P-type ATPase, partial [Oscillospiraceae bacterium]
MNESEKLYIGLTTEKAETLRIKNGENILKEKKKKGKISLFMGQFKDVLIIILLISTVLSVFMGEIVEAIAIVMIIFINAVIGFFWEYRTEKTLETLKNMTSPMADVIRDGEYKKIPSKNIVVGDILVLENGNKVLADAKICENFNLSCDESLLSGESLPVAKKINDEIFMGSMVVIGRGKAIVTHTGMDTQMGKIASMIDDIKEEPTQLQKKLAVLGKYIGIGCIFICTIVSIIGVVKGESILDMIITGISLAVAAVPEGLPAIVTITLAIAVKRILKLNAVVKKMHVIETFGSTTVICSDKTGTLTQNKMTVKEIVTPCHHLHLKEEAYATKDNEKISISMNQDLSFLFDIAMYCNNAQLVYEQEWRKNPIVEMDYKSFGDSTELALLLMGAKEKLF